MAKIYNMENAVEIKHAYVRRDERYILEDASLKISTGERIAIIGPNGAGKSTLIDVIARRTYPLARDDYKNIIFGKERWIIQELRPLIGLVSPSYDSFFATKYSVREIVASGISSSLGFDFHHNISDDVWEKADIEIAKAGVQYLSKRPMDTLSTGEKKRVMLARAAITSPPLLLLDEASNGLDFPSRADLRSVISKYATDGRTIVMVTHELNEIIPEVSRVILMKNGKIVFDGNKKDALEKDRLSSLYERTVEVVEKDGIYSAFC